MYTGYYLVVSALRYYSDIKIFMCIKSVVCVNQIFCSCYRSGVYLLNIMNLMRHSSLWLARLTLELIDIIYVLVQLNSYMCLQEIAKSLPQLLLSSLVLP